MFGGRNEIKMTGAAQRPSFALIVHFYYFGFELQKREKVFLDDYLII
jgi:hypothetical protein